MFALDKHLYMQTNAITLRLALRTSVYEYMTESSYRLRVNLCDLLQSAKHFALLWRYIFRANFTNQVIL